MNAATKLAILKVAEKIATEAAAIMLARATEDEGYPVDNRKECEDIFYSLGEETGHNSWSLACGIYNAMAEHTALLTEDK